MILVRQTFQAKYGRGDELVALFKELHQRADFPHRDTARILTDATGRFFTVVTEYEAESLGEWETTFAQLVSDRLGIPIDNVKPKTSTRLQRERNLEHDPRATLLVQGWDPTDWSKLWWVRAHLQWVTAPSAELTEELSAALAAKYPQYADRPFADVLVFRTVEITGWSAAG